MLLANCQHQKSTTGPYWLLAVLLLPLDVLIWFCIWKREHCFCLCKKIYWHFMDFFKFLKHSSMELLRLLRNKKKETLLVCKVMYISVCSQLIQSQFFILHFTSIISFGLWYSLSSKLKRKLMLKWWIFAFGHILDSVRGLHYSKISDLLQIFKVQPYCCIFFPALYMLLVFLLCHIKEFSTNNAILAKNKNNRWWS